MKNRCLVLIGAIGLLGAALTGCSSTSSTSTSPSPSTSATGNEAFCSEVQKAATKLKALGQELASGDAGKQNQAIQQLQTYYNELIAKLPANQGAAISQALEDAKSNVSKGANDPNYKQSQQKLTDAIKKQCPNISL